MSRLGKKPIEIPQGVEVDIKGQEVSARGTLGSLSVMIHPLVKIEKKDSSVVVDVSNHEDKTNKELWGLSASLIRNLIKGVKDGFEKKLEINGVGYKAAVSGSKLVLYVGYSHPVEFEIPKDIKISVEKNVITVFGTDKQKVGEISAQIRKIRKPEPYKGKGIKYFDEVIRRKQGKVVKGSGA